MTDWANQSQSGGWDDVDKYDDFKDEGLDWRKKFSIRDGDTHRILFLDTLPFFAYFHDTFNVTGQAGKILCAERNHISKEGCAWCAAKEYARHTGSFTVVDLGLVVREDGRKVLRPELSKKGKPYPQFQPKIMICGKGSKDKPGVLLTLRDDFAKDNGDSMRGLVVDAKRAGAKSAGVGSSFTLVETIKGDDAMRAYLIANGADPAVVNVADFLTPYTYTKEFEAMLMPYERMARLLKSGKQTAKDPWDAAAAANKGGGDAGWGAAGGGAEGDY